MLRPDGGTSVRCGGLLGGLVVRDGSDVMRRDGACHCLRCGGPQEESEQHDFRSVTCVLAGLRCPHCPLGLLFIRGEFDAAR
jgi:hypothetical protein